jgi:hypothetical protein
MNLSHKVLYAAALIATLLAPPAFAESFESFSGHWTGRAFGKFAAGEQTLLCRSSNSTSGENIKLSLRCMGKSESVIRITAVAKNHAGKLSGTWESPAISGTLTGTMNQHAIQLHITSAVFEASVSIVRTGNGLRISIRPAHTIPPLTVAMTR